MRLPEHLWREHIRPFSMEARCVWPSKLHRLPRLCIRPPVNGEVKLVISPENWYMVSRDRVYHAARHPDYSIMWITIYELEVGGWGNRNPDATDAARIANH